MIEIRPLAFLLSLVAMLAAVPAAADAIQHLHAFTRQAHTLSGHFSQSVYDQKGRKTQSASGEFYFSRPGKFRWVYSKPYKQLIVGDGKKVWIYDADLDQVTERKMGRAVGESPAALLAGSDKVDRYFTLKDLGMNDGLEWLEATPKGKGGSFAQVRLGFKGDMLSKMVLKDNFGQTTRLLLSDVKDNPRLESGLFRFTPPEGADVITSQ